jgi:diketogulonate reductase-like aldo/keto reductase
MEHRPFGSAGREVAVIGQGTWQMERRDKTRAVEALRRGLDLGMTHIDTAEMYGSGETEEIVGEAIRGRRDEVFLVSKVMPQNASSAGTIAACERSLRRLGTDRLDCYLLHWPGRFALDDTFGAFETLRAQGKIRSWGVSNFDVTELNEAIALAGADRLACNQVLYHLQERAVEHTVLPLCASRGIALVAYSPFGQAGFPRRTSPGGRLLEDIAKAHGATARQIALAFLLRDKSTFVIPKAATAAHVEDNAGASGIVLDPGELERIDQAFPAGRPRGLPML